MSQPTSRGAIPSATTSLPAASLIALATIATAWPAAACGALVIWAAGDFVATGSLWAFGWPFLAELLTATTFHLLAVGFGARWGIPPFFPEIAALDRALAGGIEALPDEPALRSALRAAVRFPVWNEFVGLTLASVVVAVAAMVEWLVAGSGSPNIWVIVRGGVYATVLYGAACLALGELLTRPACRVLRRAAAAAGIEPYDGFVLTRAWRIGAMVVPTIVALLVAVEIGRAVQGGTLAYTALIALSVVVSAALNWLQYENARSAIRELRDACRDLGAGNERDLVTGSIEPMLIEMAREFTAAARRVSAHRRDSGERYRAVVEAALDCIITMDHEGRIVEFNPAAEGTFGYALSEVVGKSLAETIVPPDLRARHHAGLARYLESGEEHLLGRRLELRALRADGTQFPAEIAITRTGGDGPPTFTAHLRDITARKQAEEALTASKRALEEQAEIVAALLRVEETINAQLNQPDMLDQVSRLTVEVLACDATTIFVRNRSSRAFTLRATVGSRPEVVAELQQLTLRPEEFPSFSDLEPGRLLELPDLGHSIFPADMARRWRISSLLVAPIMRGEELVGILVASYRDRTGPFTQKQRRLAIGVAHATAIALENARLIADLQAASRLKTEFVSTMSHELRTPLNVILGFCEMARDPAITAAERELYNTRIELAGRALLELVEGTLEIGRLESGRDNVQRERVNLPTFWNRLGRDYAVLPRNERVALEWRSNPPTVFLDTDPRKLATVVRNLVGNALKFTDQGFVRAEALLDGDDVVLRISDSGIGIDPQDQERIFEMFRQGDGSDSRRHAGTGLGLYIVRRFVQQLGGTVRLESRPNEGAVFEVRLPQAGIRTPDNIRAAS